MSSKKAPKKTLYDILPKEIHKEMQHTVSLLCYDIVCSSNKGAVIAAQYNQMYDLFHGKEGAVALQTNQFVKGEGHMFSHVYDADVQLVVDPSHGSTNPVKKKLKLILHQLQTCNFYAGKEIKFEYLTKKSLDRMHRQRDRIKRKETMPMVMVMKMI